jgi:monovalent cation:H+ antiporter-2, CPA2 family
MSPPAFDVSVPVVLLLATAVALLAQRFRLPPTVGFMACGALASPHAFHLIQNVALLKLLGEIGLVFLLFMVGLELSPEKLRQMKRLALRAGSLYMGIGTFLLGGFMALMGAPPGLAFVLGGTFTLSSTALVLKGLEEAGAGPSTTGRVALGTLIAQDMAVIPLLLCLPMVGDIYAKASGGGFAWQPVAWSLGKALVALSIVTILSFYLMPRTVDKLAHTRNRELFTLSVFSLGLGMAVLTNALGLSLEAGAFVGGLALSGSVYSKQVLSDCRPFRDVFAALFFVSLGAVLNVGYMAQHAPLITGIFTGLVLLKLLVGLAAGKLTRLPWKTSVLFSLALFQVSELSFMVLQHLGTSLAEASPARTWLSEYAPMLVHVAVISLIVTPFLNKVLFTRIAPWAQRVFTRWDEAELLRQQTRRIQKCQASETPDVPVLLVGFGPVARQAVEALKRKDIAFRILEMNPGTVKHLVSEGIPAVYGDATQPGVLETLGVRQARLLLVTVPDHAVATTIIHHARCLNVELRIMARARFQGDIQHLYEAGAHGVVHDELEVGERFVTQSLAQLGVSHSEALAIGRKVHREFEEAYYPGCTRNTPEWNERRVSLMGGTQLEWMTLPEQAPIIGQSVADAQLRKRYRINLVAILRDDEGECHVPSPNDYFNPGDVILALGRHEHLNAFRMDLYGRGNEAEIARNEEGVA